MCEPFRAVSGRRSAAPRPVLDDERAIGDEPAARAVTKAATAPLPHDRVSASTPRSKVRIASMPGPATWTSLTVAPAGANLRR